MRALKSRRGTHVAIHYPHGVGERVYGLFVFPAIAIAIFIAALLSSHQSLAGAGGISIRALGIATALTLARLLCAFVLSYAVAIPLAIAATHSAGAQKILLPVFDILQSIPVLAFFPVLVIVFISLGQTEVAAIFVIFLSMLWNFVFALIGGVGLIPRDIIYAAEVFGVRGVAYMRRVLLPALVPQMVVGGILALAQGWNIIIVAEVIRTYLPATSLVPNLFGLGSVLVEASASGNIALFLYALCAVVAVIAIINFFVWQPLLKYAQRFKFE